MTMPIEEDIRRGKHACLCEYCSESPDGYCGSALRFAYVLAEQREKSAAYTENVVKLKEQFKQEAEIALKELESHRAIVEAARAWRKDWPDTKDVLNAEKRGCDCVVCSLIRAVDALAHAAPTEETK